MERDDNNNDSGKELKMIDEVLGKSKIETPSSNFTHRVMMNLHSMPVASSLSPKNGLFLFLGTIVAVAMLTGLVGAGIFDAVTETINVPQLKTTIPVSGNVMMKGLIFVSIALAFLLLDRTILRPFFNKRAMR